MPLRAFLSYIPAPLRRLWGPNLLLAALLLAALSLRLYGIDWDDGHGFHPDARSFYLRADAMFRILALAPGYEYAAPLSQWPDMTPGLPGIATALSAARSPLNPHWFPLGSILIYALVLIRSAAEPFTDWGAMDLRFAGRALAALADTASVAMLFVIGRRMYGLRTGLLAAALTALAVIHIQHAHFYRPEPFTVLASLASLWAMLRLIDARRRRDAVLLGVMVGLAMATKISVAPLILPLLLTLLWVARDRAGGQWRNLTPPALAKILPTAALTGLAALAVFALATPYALLDWTAFIADIRAQTEMARQAGHWPFTWQYADTPAFWYQIRQTVVWGLGLPLGIAAWTAAPFTLWMAWRGGQAQRADILLLAWAVPAFLFLELFEVKFLRYVFPLLPFYILMAARMLTALTQWAQERRNAADSASKTGAGAANFTPDDAPFSEEWHATPPTVGDDVLFDEPLAGAASFSDAPFSEEWHATPPLSGVTISPYPPPAASTASAAAIQPPWRIGLNRQIDRWAYPASVALLAVVIAATAWYAVAFVGIYSRPHTAVTAAQWINANIPAGARIVNAGSLWDERIPDLGRYDVWDFPAYHRPDDRRKIAELAAQLAGADYLVFYSNRAYGAIARLPDEFPQSAAFYRQLFAGRLGYGLEQGFTSYPSLAGITLRDNPYGRAELPAPAVTPGGSDGQPGGIVINLGYADENAVAYDHPQVLIFRNTERLPSAALQERIHAAANANAAIDTPPLLLSPAQLEIQQSGGTWSQLFNRDGWAARIPWLAWLLTIELIGLAAFPFIWWLLRPLPDRGILLARSAGLLMVAWIAWMLVSAGVMRYSAGTVWLALAIVAVPSAAVLWRQWRPLWQWLRGQWRLVIAAEMLFLLAFCGFLLIRAANPDLGRPDFWNPEWERWVKGGEKPMELAYFTAVIRSTAMPPYDPWFSGGYLNYYYWGYFILSIPVRLTGILPATAFNLAVPLLFALTAAGAGSLAYNLAAAAKGRRTRANIIPPPGPGDAGTPRKDNRAVRIRRWRPGGAALVGLIAAVMAAVAGNLDGAVQLVQLLSNRAQGISASLSLSGFDYWRSSRAIPVLDEFTPSRLTPWLESRDWMDAGYHITEFPFFTFLFADLHAHMMAMPLALLALALGFALLTGATAAGWRSLRVWMTAALLGLAVGSLWAVNSWEYPAYILLAAGIVAAAALLMPGARRTRLTAGIGLTALMLSVSYFAFLPFHSATETFGIGLEPTRWRTPLLNYLLIHALPLLASAVLLAAVLPRAYAPLVARLRRAEPLPPVSQWLLLAAALGLAAAIYCWAAGFAAAGLLVILLALTGWALAAALRAASDYPERRSDVMALAMLSLAFGIGIGVEFIRVEGDIGRMNTVFKYYLVAWLLFAGAGGYGLWRGWTASGNTLRWMIAGLVGVVMAGALVYPTLATPVRISDNDTGNAAMPLTLDGAAWMDDAIHWEREQAIALHGDAAAIRWLQDNVTGAPVILEAHGDQYRWNGRISAFTGLPTVLGWPWHQTQQRGSHEPIRARAADIARLYHTADCREAVALLDKYGVAYIMVGDLERIYYAAAGIAKFDAMAASGILNPVYDHDGVHIYQVVPGGNQCTAPN